MNHDFSLLIKPASADCNLNCDYCFYLEKNLLYPETSRHRMSDEVLEQLIRSYMSTSQSIYSFGWQGGEPTLMGLEFFEKVVEFQKQYGHAGANVGNGLQTNATLIDERMSRHFSQYKFLMGCSLDGPPDVHNHYRKTIDLRGSYKQVIQGIKQLKQHQVEFNILVLVSQANVRKAAEVYRFLVNKGFYHHQYIPCVEFDDQGILEPFAITGAEWGNFLCEIYDIWSPKDIYRVSIRQFDSILAKKVDGVSNVCTMGDNCCQYFVVEHNGDVYPCDFFVREPLKLGNVMDTTWEEMAQSPLYQQFGKQKKRWNTRCQACDFLSLCQGDCLKHRLTAGQGPDQLSYLCEGWQTFFNHTARGFELLTGDVKKQRNQNTARQPVPLKSKSHQPARIGRNKPCPCGSGLKYKKCCGK